MANNNYLCQLMAIQFYMIDLNLYLDTHPNDSEAIKTYNEMKKEYDELVKLNEKNGTQLFPGSPDTSNWHWISGPWPWENMYN